MIEGPGHVPPAERQFARDGDGCRGKCGMHAAKWWSWFATRFCESPETALAAAASTAVTSNTGLAMLVIPENMDGYMAHIGAKSRNMVRKAQKHFVYSVYSTAGHLQDLFEINTSMDAKQLSAKRENRPRRCGGVTQASCLLSPAGFQPAEPGTAGKMHA